MPSDAGKKNATASDPTAAGTLPVLYFLIVQRPPQSTLFPTRRSSDLTFNPTTGAWSYTLNQALADPLTAGQIVHDHLVVTSFDGTATHDIDVTITGSNDNATITTSVSEDNAVLEIGRASCRERV